MVNVSSIKGQVSTPFGAGYGITKFGAETFSDILRLELKKWGISVSIIEPCNFGGATNCIDVSCGFQEYFSIGILSCTMSV